MADESLVDEDEMADEGSDVPVGQDGGGAPVGCVQIRQPISSRTALRH
jgi:hypothetical protein